MKMRIDFTKEEAQEAVSAFGFAPLLIGPPPSQDSYDYVESWIKRRLFNGEQCWLHIESGQIPYADYDEELHGEITGGHIEIDKSLMW